VETSRITKVHTIQLEDDDGFFIPWLILYRLLTKGNSAEITLVETSGSTPLFLEKGR
jgi:hypothetical protein